MQKRVLFLLILTAMAAGASGQVIEPFQPRASQYSPDKSTYTIKGDFTVLGNTNLIVDPYDDNMGNNNTGDTPLLYGFYNIIFRSGIQG